MNKLLTIALTSVVLGASSTSALAFSSFGISANSNGIVDLNVTEYLDFTGASFIQNTFSDATHFSFADNGVFKVTGSDTFNVANVFGGNEITAVFHGGAGTGTLGGALNFTGGILDFYSDPLQDYGSTTGIFGANNGTLIGSFALTSGTGNVDPISAVPNGNITLNFKATSLKLNTWFDQFGNDLSTNPSVFNFVTTNATRVTSVPAGSPIASEVICQLAGFNCPSGTPFDNTPLNFLVSNNGQDRMQVPEPGSLALIGAGLMALGSLRRRARNA